jgi:hypothetical protein
VTEVLARPANSQDEDTGAPRSSALRFTAVIPWVLILAGYVTGPLLTKTAPGDVAVYVAYLIVGVVVPGTLVYRALRGSRGNWAEDLGLGGATGLLVQLLGWAISAALGLQAVLWAWPLLVIAVFLAVPGLRRHWRIAEPRPLPLRWHWMMAAGLVGVLLWGAHIWSSNPMPPVDSVVYQDLWYHLALVQEMTRTMPFEVPQLAGEGLRYHYLSDADMAAASMMTGVDPWVVMLRLWFVPVAAITAVVFAAITRDLSGKWWAGPLAGGISLVGVPLGLGAAVSPSGGSPLTFLSPSQSYALPFLGLLTMIAVDALRGRKPGWAWLLVPTLALACAGAKSSALPPLIAGLILATVFLWIRDKAFPRTMAVLFVAVLIPMLVGTKLFAGGGAGTLGLQPLANLRWMSPYSQTLGVHDGITEGGFLPIGLQHASAKAWAYVLLILLWWFVMQLPRWIGVAGIANKRLRQDPAAWLLAGMLGAGTAAAFAFFHPSASQGYFYLGALPFGVILSVWFLAENSRRWWVVAAGLAAGALYDVVIPEMPRVVDQTSWRAWAWAMSAPVLRAAIFVAVGAVVVLVLRKRFRSLVVAVTAAILGASFIGGLHQFAGLTYAHIYLPHAKAEARRIISADEMRAAIWLDENAADDDVVATNVHCQPINRFAPCDARAFWVAALGGHRTVVESWGYSDEAVAANGVNNLKYMLQPAPDQETYLLNQRVFMNGDAADLQTLKDTHHVRWLFADARASVIAPSLANLATVRYQLGPVTIYEVNR